MKGERPHIEGQAGEAWMQCGEGVECGSSDLNAVIAHHYDSDNSNTSYISTSKSYEIAAKFATINNLVKGYVYTLDINKFKKYGVISYERTSPDEKEVTVRTKDLRPIPHQVIINKQLVEPA